MNPCLGEVKLFAGDFPPKGWEFCRGQLLAVSSNPALFSVIGNTYGGNGTITFALPDLRGREAVGAGQGPGLSSIDFGKASGSETEMLSHAQAGVKAVSIGNDAAQATQTTVLGVSNAQPHENRFPYLALNYIICIEGDYPRRD